jgi:hypothetical protein
MLGSTLTLDIVTQRDILTLMLHSAIKRRNLTSIPIISPGADTLSSAFDPPPANPEARLDVFRSSAS